MIQDLESVQFQGDHICDVLAPLVSAASQGQAPIFESVKAALIKWDRNNPAPNDRNSPGALESRKCNAGRSLLALNQVQTTSFQTLQPLCRERKVERSGFMFHGCGTTEGSASGRKKEGEGSFKIEKNIGSSLMAFSASPTASSHA